MQKIKEQKVTDGIFKVISIDVHKDIAEAFATQIEFPKKLPKKIKKSTKIGSF